MNPQGPFLAPGAYPKDKPWGIAVAVLSASGLCCGLGIAGAGSLFGLVGAGALAGDAGRGHADPGATAAVVGISGLVVVIGIVLALCSAAQVAGGFGIMGSRRWGFNVTLAFSILSLVLHLSHVASGTGILGLAINGVIVWYCWSRLSGREGPTPV